MSKCGVVTPHGVCDDSRLCAELSGHRDGIAFFEVYGGDPPSRVLHQTDHFAVLIDLAPLVVGHLLIVPKEHRLSFGQVPLHQWEELLGLRGQVVDQIRHRYGEVMILEHGSSSDLTFSACVSHAHWHVLPLLIDLLPTLEADGLSGSAVDSIHDLRAYGRADLPYILYDKLEAGTWLFDGGISKRHQYLRAVVAEQVGIPDPEWDWSLFQNRDAFRSTYRDLEAAWD